jgi:hypothetical protein
MNRLSKTCPIPQLCMWRVEACNKRGDRLLRTGGTLVTTFYTSGRPGLTPPATRLLGREDPGPLSNFPSFCKHGGLETDFTKLLVGTTVACAVLYHEWMCPRVRVSFFASMLVRMLVQEILRRFEPCALCISYVTRAVSGGLILQQMWPNPGLVAN